MANVADAKYTTTLQPISVYGYRFATATVLEAAVPTGSSAAEATTVSFGRDVKILARLDGATVTTTNGNTIPGTAQAGDRFYFLVQ